jgi:hypothetical protein
MNTKSKFKAKPFPRKFGSKGERQKEVFPLRLLQDVLEQAFSEGSEMNEEAKAKEIQEWSKREEAS